MLASLEIVPQLPPGFAGRTKIALVIQVQVDSARARMELGQRLDINLLDSTSGAQNKALAQ